MRLRENNPGVTTYVLTAAAIAVIVFLIAPIAVIIPMSFGTNSYLEFPPTGFTVQWYARYFNDPGWLQPTVFSLQIGLLAALVSGALGTMCALGARRFKPGPAAGLRALILAPIIMPNIVFAIGAFFLLARLQMLGTLWAFVLAHSVLALPFVFLTVNGRIQTFDDTLETAARSLGATWWDTFRLVTFPIILPSVMTGVLFAFIISFDESVVSYFISDTRDKTLPRRLFENLEYSVTPVVAAVSSLLIGVSIIVLVGVWLIRRFDRSRL